MSDFGGKMRLARERRGISLRQIAAITKISMAALEALERNDVSKLPGGIFSRSFVRSYATEVGLDPDETVREFLDRFQGAPAASLPTPATVSEDEAVFENQQRIAALVVKLVLITVPLIVLILYFTMRTRPPGTASAVTAPSGVPAAAVPARADGAPTSSTPAQTPAPVATAGARVPPIAGNGLSLEIRPTGDCWVRLTVDGKLIVARVMHAGETATENVQDTAVIQIGDAGAFAFTINGRPARSLGPAGSVRTATITKDTLARYVQ